MKIPSLKDIPDLGPVEQGEYDLVVRTVKDDKSEKTGREGMQLIIDILDVENTLPIFHTVWFPDNDKDDEAKIEVMWRMIKEFITALGFDPDEEYENEDFVGTTFTALLGVKEYNGRVTNEIIKVTG